MVCGIGWNGLWRAILGWVSAVIGIGIPAAACAEEAIERSLLHPDAVFVVEVKNPLGWTEHPLANRVWSAISQSQELQAALETPEFQRVHVAQDYLEAASGQNWQEAVWQITAGGVWLAATPKPNERFTLIVSAASSDVWTKLQTAVWATLKSQGQQPPKPQDYLGVKGYRIDKSHVAIVGHRLVAASSEADLKHIIQGLQQLSPKELDAATKSEARPSLTVQVDLKTIRQSPDLKKALERPASDAGQVAILGGWLDLLGSAGRLTGNLQWPASSEQLQLTLTASDVNPTSPTNGFFAQSPTDVLAPLLEPPGTIYSASWFRDYAALWNQRDELLTESSLEKLEKGDNDIKQQFSVFGVSYSPSEMFKQLGTQFRVVMTRAKETEYRVKLEDQLPTAALCVSLRDQAAFLEQAEPFFRAIGLIAAFGEAKMLTKTSQHAEATLKGLWFRDDDKAASQGNRVRYNFNPTWTVAREHFIVGSTRGIVATVIDELDRQAKELETNAESLAGSDRITERQLLSFSQFGEAVTDFREALLQGSALDRGLPLPTAIQEIDFVKDAINALGQLSTQAAFTQQGFEYKIHIQPEQHSNQK